MSAEYQKIQYHFASENALYMSYMPFIKQGGLFIRTKLMLPLNTMVILSISLLDNVEIYELEAKVVWITPRGAQGNKPAGLGLQFLGDTAKPLTSKIETHLAGLLKSLQLTDTM
ncbi:MAG: pilus assembly protein PilZ [Legionellaceae bacterium]|nr:pilus assembly protein PilZ [Legionellaceae bacterium]HCA90201.1 pilus assembly protein PilZ [Legionellales bacterium]|tara:strand:- start:1597 stop:1938 length:342 start_codon:yes stop_codon:yes gene_type:complete